MTIPLCLLLVAAALPLGDVSSPPDGIAVADTVPNLQVTTLDGEVVGLRDLLGERITVINLWATWCLPCREEIPDLNTLYVRRSRGDVTVVGIAVESGSIERIERWLQPYGVRYPMATGVTGQQMIDEFRAPGLPFTLLVDADGVVRRSMYGQQTTERLEQALSAIRADEP